VQAGGLVGDVGQAGAQGQAGGQLGEGDGLAGAGQGGRGVAGAGDVPASGTGVNGGVEAGGAGFGVGQVGGDLIEAGEDLGGGQVVGSQGAGGARSWPISEAAEMSCPVTSPTVSAQRPSGRGMTSNQSPPISAVVWAATYR
jgi:hypothetical protein